MSRTRKNTISFKVLIVIRSFIDNIFSYSAFSAETEIIGIKTTVLQFSPIVGHSFCIVSFRQQLMTFFDNRSCCSQNVKMILLVVQKIKAELKWKLFFSFFIVLTLKAIKVPNRIFCLSIILYHIPSICFQCNH